MPEFSYRYPRPALTVDLAVFCNGKVLLIRRGQPPFQGCWALPGGFVEAGEDGLGEAPRNAAVRELIEEAAVIADPDDLVEAGVFAQPGRDPRGWVVSVAFAVTATAAQVEPMTAGDDACDVGLFDPADLPAMAFDHEQIIAEARERLAAAAVTA